MAPAGEQTKKAQWRGEIKIQIQLGVPAKQASFYVYSQDHSIDVILPSDKKLRGLLNGRLKAYFKATLLGDDTINIRQEVPERDW